MPMAKTVPAMPRKNATTSRSPKLPSWPTRAVSSTSGAVRARIAVNITRPPRRSVRAPTGTRAMEPTKIGIATSSAVCEELSSICSA